MQGTYSVWLVALSIAVAILVSLAALKITARLATGEPRHRFAWYVAGAFVMGVGIWSMHFIGMLAFSLPIRLTYDLGLTFASLGLSILTSGFALAIAARSNLTFPRLAFSALVMGTGICAMHFVGMRAIRLVPMLTYEPGLLAASIAIAYIASFVGLWLAFKLRAGSSWRARAERLGASVVMGIAIAGMHYTGMAASRFSPDAYCVGGVPLDNGWIAISIGLFSLIILAITVFTAIYDSHLQTRTRARLDSLRRANQRLQHQALHDALTGLPNRVLARERLARAIATAEQDHRRVAIMAIDLDRFKSVNDSLGHSVGDALLKEVARRVSRCVRNQDTVARIGGDEFVVVLPSIVEMSDAQRVADSIVTSLSEPFHLASGRLHTSASLGVAFYPDHGREAAELIVRADEAMYYAKQHGGGVQLFRPEMNVFTPERLELENDLSLAVRAKQFELYYQPKIDLAEGRVVGAEALLRWRHPTRGWVSPDIFVPLAEEAGLTLAIGDWVLHEACRQARCWELAGMRSMRIAVNVSERQFRQPDLVDKVKRAIEAAQVSPDLLEIELTESSVMTNSEDSARTLAALSRLGVLITLDDFGTGYSNISYLRRLPLDKLKIDRSFVQDLEGNEEMVSIVKAIVALAHALRLKVVAEGVESERQVEILRELCCDQYQGYLSSPPVDAATFEALMAERGFAPPIDVNRTYSRLSAFVPKRMSAR
jgi:diguanylate cyclase (GGDEF)-like protein